MSKVTHDPNPICEGLDIEFRKCYEKVTHFVPGVPPENRLKHVSKHPDYYCDKHASIVRKWNGTGNFALVQL